MSQLPAVALGAIDATASAVTAWIAWLALRTWKHQDRANREAHFLDSLVDAMHAYVAALATPVTMIEIVQIGFNAYAPTDNDRDSYVYGAIAYIKARGEDSGRRLNEAIQAANHEVAALKAMATKGQIFSFKGYKECYAALINLASQLDRMAAVSAILRSNLTTDNPEVFNHIRSITTVDRASIDDAITENSKLVLAFVKDTYALIYR
ncbi:hypothetical protein [Pseudoxanthomonas beigongshangi]